MKKALVGILLLIGSNSLADSRPQKCVKNRGHQGVKQICFFYNEDFFLTGFLLQNANATRSYLAVVGRNVTGGGDEMKGGRIVRTYTVTKSDFNFVPKGEITSEIQMITTWSKQAREISLRGETPGGQALEAIVDKPSKKELSPTTPN